MGKLRTANNRRKRVDRATRDRAKSLKPARSADSKPVRTPD
jgi:hypothetical protein